MMSAQTWTTLCVLVVIFQVHVNTQDYEDNFLDYETEDGEISRLQPNYDAHVMYAGECPIECFCPASYPFAMYCDHRQLKTIPNVPGHILHLYIQHNDIEAVTAKSFVNATNLKDINLSYNNLQLSKVDKDVFKTLEKLTGLHLEHNNLEEVPSGLPNTIQRLNLGFNQISKISVEATRDLTNLTVLDLGSNKLTDAGIKGKILSGMKSLTQVNLCSNKLKSMPADLPESVLQMMLDNNSISSIPEGYFKKTPNLLSLHISHNKIKSFPYDVFNSSRLMELHLGHNQLSKPFFIPRTLQHLYLNHNDFKDLNVSLMCPSLDPVSPNMLTYIRMDNNKLKGPLDHYVYQCFPSMRMIFYGNQRKADEDEAKTLEKPDMPKRENKAIDKDG